MRRVRYHRGIGATPIIGTYQVSTNPGSQVSMAVPGGLSMGGVLVLGAVGVAGFLLYRHFKKKGTSASSAT